MYDQFGAPAFDDDGHTIETVLGRAPWDEAETDGVYALCESTSGTADVDHPEVNISTSTYLDVPGAGAENESGYAIALRTLQSSTSTPNHSDGNDGQNAIVDAGEPETTRHAIVFSASPSC